MEAVVTDVTRGPDVDADPGAEAATPQTARGDGLAGRSAWVASTYFAEGLPYSVVHQVAAQMFTAMGASLGAIGLTSLYGLAWNLKFAWSPLVDQTGTTRRWLWLLELALAGAIALVALPASRGDLSSIARVLVAVSVLAATHDVAVDGFYVRTLDTEAQTALSGLRVTAYRAALLVGRGGLVTLAGLTSWPVCFGVAGALLFAQAIAHARLLPRPASDRPAEVTGDFAHKFSEGFRTFLRQPGIGPSLAFLLTFRAGDALMFAMNAAFLQWLGLDTTAQGVFSGTFGTAASVAGSLVGAAIITGRGLDKTLFPIALAQSLAIPLYALLAIGRPALPWIVAVVLVEQFVAGIGTAAFMVFIMRRARGAHKATHFAIATALMSVATTAVGSASGFLAGAVGFFAFFLLAFAASLPGVALARWVPRD